MRKVIFKLSREFFPQSKDRYPLLYFEHGRIEVDDSSGNFRKFDVGKRVQ